MAAFGLGQKSELDFPGESTGILKPADDLWGSERVTVAYGQGVASTSLQLVAAINTIANDGVYVSPKLVKATVGPDYHIRLEGHHYSVPHELIRQQLWARLTASTVEIFRGGRRMACHRRAAPGDMGATTLNDHRPASHRRHAEVTPQMLRERAARIGPATVILVDVILRDRPHPEQGFRSCLGILRLGRSHGAERLEAACDRALQIPARTLTSVRSILLNRLDGRRPVQPPEAPPITHANIRGPQFFH
jgi:transposase